MQLTMLQGMTTRQECKRQSVHLSLEGSSSSRGMLRPERSVRDLTAGTVKYYILPQSPDPELYISLKYAHQLSSNDMAGLRLPRRQQHWLDQGSKMNCTLLRRGAHAAAWGCAARQCRNSSGCSPAAQGRRVPAHER